MTRWVLLRCDSTGDLYPVTTPSPIPQALLEKPPVLCHACQLGKHVRLSLVSSNTVVTSCFDIVHSDVWTSRQYTNPNLALVHPMVTRFRVGTNRPTERLNLHVSLVMHFVIQTGKIRYKARLVANGSTQLEGVDVDETFSMVVKPGTIQTVLSLAASRHWPIHQLDVKNAFLHGDLSKTVYMHQPPGFRDSAHHDYVCLLQQHGIDTAYLLLYVNDIILTASSKGLFLSQKKYAIEILEKAHMVFCNPSRTPFDTESKLGVDGDPQVCLHMHDPQGPHLSALKRILRYVQGTLYYGWQLFSFSTTDLVAYSDTDWAGCPTTRRSTSGYCVFLANNLLSWSAKRQPTLSRSSAEAEYHGVAETCWLRNLLRELHTPLSSATMVYCDNVSVVYLSSNPVQHQRTKHIEIDIHFVRDLVAAGQVRVLHVPSRYQFADIFTKGLPSAFFEEFRSSLSGRSLPAPSAGDC
ncbi:ribonuclease H-like domain-containing protein [Tanacetum coccineum]